MLEAYCTLVPSALALPGGSHTPDIRLLVTLMSEDSLSTPKIPSSSWAGHGGNAASPGGPVA